MSSKSVRNGINDAHVREYRPISSPSLLKREFPMSSESHATVMQSRETIVNILRKDDPRLLVIIGPCSIHDEKGAVEYASRLNQLRNQLGDQLEIMMRVYFEKPRTTVGWKGFINDPHLDGSLDMGRVLEERAEAASEHNRTGHARGYRIP